MESDVAAVDPVASMQVIDSPEFLDAAQKVRESSPALSAASSDPVRPQECAA